MTDTDIRFVSAIVSALLNLEEIETVVLKAWGQYKELIQENFWLEFLQGDQKCLLATYQ